jgi:hypothetical protein
MQVTVRLVRGKLREAGGSTSKRASRYLPVGCFGFGKFSFQGILFVSVACFFPWKDEKSPNKHP